MGKNKNDSPKRLPSRGGRIGETSIRKGKNTSGNIANNFGSSASGAVASSEDYSPSAPVSKMKNAYITGRILGKEELTKDFAELENTSKNLKTAGSKLMEDFRKTRRFASKTQGPWHFQ